jgi:HEAT repeat protein
MIFYAPKYIMDAWAQGFYPVRLPKLFAGPSPFIVWNISVEHNQNSEWGLCSSCDIEIRDCLEFNNDFKKKYQDGFFHHQCVRIGALEGNRIALEALIGCQDKFATPILINLLSDNDLYEREFAIDALEKLKDRRAVPTLIEAIDSQDEYIWHSAILILGLIKDVRAVDPLIHRLNFDTRPGVKYIAAKALGQIGDKKAVSHLINLLGTIEFPKGIIEALGMIGDEEALKSVQPFLTSEDKQLKRSAKKAVKRIKRKSEGKGSSLWDRICEF